MIDCDPSLPDTPLDSLEDWPILAYAVPSGSVFDDDCGHRIAQIKNLFSGTLVLWARPSIAIADCGWVEPLRGLGFRLLQSKDYWGMCYSIRDYKTVPDWLNPRHWAHPERWDQSRW
ncbi:DUF6231 family protein [Halothiobacillus sp. DCM-1]|uniref:DUF6231 family protein n=1 Tax=Halothiobacillus sp. DCM-1 TaxID=3112558 RepID=UPI00324C6BAC